MIPTRAVPVALYSPGEDAHGAPVDAWSVPASVEVYGWGPSGGGQPVQGNRLPIHVELDVFAAEVVGGPRARWTLPEGEFEQVGHAADYRNGPWWPTSGVVVSLKRWEG